MHACCWCSLTGSAACDNCPNGPGRLAPVQWPVYHNDPIDYDKLAKKLKELIDKPKSE